MARFRQTHLSCFQIPAIRDSSAAEAAVRRRNIVLLLDKLAAGSSGDLISHLLLVPGNLGIDFTGSTLVHFKWKSPLALFTFGFASMEVALRHHSLKAKVITVGTRQ